MINEKKKLNGELKYRTGTFGVELRLYKITLFVLHTLPGNHNALRDIVPYQSNVSE